MTKIPTEIVALAFQGGYTNEVNRDFALYKGQWEFLALDREFWKGIYQANT